MYNSAYFEHTFLAQRMGVELVEGRDLVVDQNHVYMRTTLGPARVDVIYRRIDDDYLDPLTFRPTAPLAYPAWSTPTEPAMSRWPTASAPASPTTRYLSFVPDMIRYYLKQDAVYAERGNLPAVGSQHMSHILANLDKLVVKTVNESGGYGMLIGPASTAEQRAEFAAAIRAKPRDFIAQPTISLSQHPTFVDGRLEGRHVDLRRSCYAAKRLWSVRAV